MKELEHTSYKEMLKKWRLRNLFGFLQTEVIEVYKIMNMVKKVKWSLW